MYGTLNKDSAWCTIHPAHIFPQNSEQFNVSTNPEITRVVDSIYSPSGDFEGPLMYKEEKWDLQQQLKVDYPEMVIYLFIFPTSPLLVGYETRVYHEISYMLAIKIEVETTSLMIFRVCMNILFIINRKILRASPTASPRWNQTAFRVCSCRV